MRWNPLVCALFLMAGCASQRPAAQPQLSFPQSDEDSPQATALVFSAPLTMNQPLVFLPRDIRQPSAFVRFDELITTFYDVYTEDRQTNDFTDRYLRTATIERVGVSYR